MALGSVLFILQLASFSIAFAEVCLTSHSVGLSNGTFGERGLIATSYLDVYHNPNKARLNHSKAWAPAFLGEVSRPVEEFVQITFIDGSFLVTSIDMQGSPSNDWWVTKFRLATSIDGEHFQKYQQEYDGNRDRASIVTVPVQNPLPSVYFRVIPTQWMNHIALRMELYGCDYFTT